METTQQLETNLTYFQNRRRHSINFCLWVLGAPKDEVYYHENDRILRTPQHASKRSIYDKYSKQELRDWATHLRNEALKKYHPDHHQGKEDYYTKICQDINEVYNTAMKILNLWRYRL
jgi:hypothetical protein